MMDALSVVTQLRDLASEPQNREAIVQDQGCLPGLVLFLDHQDPHVLFATLQTMRYLAEWPLNIPTMKNELGMMVSLETLMESPERERRRNKPQFFLNSSKGKNKSILLLVNLGSFPHQILLLVNLGSFDHQILLLVNLGSSGAGSRNADLGSEKAIRDLGKHLSVYVVPHLSARGPVSRFHYVRSVERLIPQMTSGMADQDSSDAPPEPQ
ncbi:unnamed protein product, partial [Coregonus sp. 'balchen']